MALTNEIAELAFKVEKFAAKSATVEFPKDGEKIQVELENDNQRMKFHLNVIRSLRQPKQVTFNLRYREVYSIRRLDLFGNHNNPEIDAPAPIFKNYVGHKFRQEDHVHIHDEAFGDKWAIPLKDLPEIGIEDSDMLPEKLSKFLSYCNVRGLEFTLPIF